MGIVDARWGGAPGDDPSWTCGFSSRMTRLDEGEERSGPVLVVMCAASSMVAWSLASSGWDISRTMRMILAASREEAVSFTSKSSDALTISCLALLIAISACSCCLFSRCRSSSSRSTVLVAAFEVIVF